MLSDGRVTKSEYNNTVKTNLVHISQTLCAQVLTKLNIKVIIGRFSMRVVWCVLLYNAPQH